MGKIFINQNKQLRSGWKIAITLAGALLITFILQGVIAAMAIVIGLSNDLAFETALYQIVQDPFWSALALMAQSVAFISSAILFWKIFDRKPLKDMGMPSFKNHWKQLIFGLLLGIVSISGVFLILNALDMIHVEQNFDSPNLLVSIIRGLILFIFVGFSEEIFSRGYNMTVLKQTGNNWIVVLVSSLIFSLMHGMNPNVSIIGLLNIFLIAILFAYMFIKTKNIWIPIGYHITWNFFQGNIFGFPVSGLEQNGLYKISLTSANIWNGGDFGAEGGLVTTAIIILGLLAVHYYVKVTKNKETEL